MTNQTLNSNAGESPKVYRASWVCSVDRPPIKNGFVEVDSNRITNVGSIANYQGPRQRIVDLGDGAIIPGLINAHCHLEFSDLPRPLGEPGIRFTDWIRLIVKSRADSNEQSPDKKSNAIKQGIEQSAHSGVAGIGEICTLPFEQGAYDCQTPISILHFLEQLGSDQSALENQQAQLLKHLNRSSVDSVENESLKAQTTFGASPHAPYSCHPKLVEQMCRLAAENNRIVAMHLAETKAERELLDSQSGDFVELLKDFGVWNPNAFPKDRSIFSTLATLSKTKSLIVHGNYLNEAELDFVAQHRDHMNVVFCPRTHAFFEHDAYPLNEILERKIEVAIGTDSLASNPDLNLFAELKEVARSFPQLAAEQVLKFGTINGAAAIGYDSQLGTLAPGKAAALCFVEQSEGDTASPINEWLFGPSSRCRRLV